MAIGQTTTAELNSLYEQIYDDAWLTARAEMIMPNLVSVLTDKTDTATRHFSQWGTVTAREVAEADDYASPDKFSKTEIATVTPSEKMAQAILKDRVIRQDPSARAEASQEIGLAMAEKIEADLLSTFDNLSGGAGVAIGGAGTAITWGHLLAAQSQLVASKVPGPFNVVLHPYHFHKLGAAVDLTKSLASTPDVVKDELARDMYVGSYQRMRFFMSAHISVDASDDAYGAIFAPGAIAWDVRQAPSPEMERDASARASEMNIVADYGVVARRPGFGIPLLFDASVPTS